MARQAGIRRAQLLGAHRVGQAEAVVMPKVIAHVELAGHVAIHALGSRLAGDMPVVLGRIVVFGLQAFAVDPGDRGLARGVVALQADAVALGLEFGAMGVVAIAATHALVGHLALQE
ncbi:hypothetical protein D3C75_979810 [compost metagenome]